MLVHGPIECNGDWIESMGSPLPEPLVVPSNPVAREIQRMIRSFNCAAQVFRKDASDEGLFGADDVAYLSTGAPIWIQFVPLSPEDIAQKIDAKASVLPGADVLAEDRLQIGDNLYRVQTAAPQNWFGILTHKTLKLVQHREG